MYLFVYCRDGISTCTCIGRSVWYFCTCTVGYLFYLYWRECICTCTGGGVFVNVPGRSVPCACACNGEVHLVLEEVDLYLYL